MNKKQYFKNQVGTMQYFIATDKHNLLKDNENIIVYTLKKIYYKIKLSIKYKRFI